jgi:hypothetical protein
MLLNVEVDNCAMVKWAYRSFHNHETQQPPLHPRRSCTSSSVTLHNGATDHGEMIQNSAHMASLTDYPERCLARFVFVCDCEAALIVREQCCYVAQSLNCINLDSSPWSFQEDKLQVGTEFRLNLDCSPLLTGSVRGSALPVDFLAQQFWISHPEIPRTFGTQAQKTRNTPIHGRCQ